MTESGEFDQIMLTESGEARRGLGLTYDYDDKLLFVSVGHSEFGGREQSAFPMSPDEWGAVVEAIEGRPMHLGDRVVTACLTYQGDRGARARGIGQFMAAAEHELEEESFDLVTVAVPKGSGQNAAEKLGGLLGFGGSSGDRAEAEATLAEVRQWLGEQGALVPGGDCDASPQFFTDPSSAPEGWRPGESLTNALRRQLDRLQVILEGQQGG